MSAESGAIEQLLRRDRQVVVAALVLVCLLAWIYTVSGVGMGMNAIEMSRPFWEISSGHNMAMAEINIAYFFILLAMWWIMMIAMMLPSAAPTILLAAAINRRSNADNPPFGEVTSFITGYLLAWLVFSLAAVFLQLMLERNGLLSAMMHSKDNYLAAFLLLAAGGWQLSPVKHACLKHCRSPVAFVTRYRRPGNWGAIIMGLHHGSYCLGCCWFLMLLLFVGGVMNLFWIVGLALFVLIEKLAKGGIWFGRVSGVGFIISGILLLVI